MNNNFINENIIQSEFPLVSEDRFHTTLEFDMKFFNFTRGYQKINSDIELNYNKANFDLITNNLSFVNWNSDFLNLNTCDSTSKFYCHLENIINKHVPKYPKYKSKALHWLCLSSIEVVKQKISCQMEKVF